MNLPLDVVALFVVHVEPVRQLVVGVQFVGDTVA